MVERARFRLLTVLLACTALFQPNVLTAEQVPVRLEGPLYYGGPIWRIELAAPAEFP